MRDYIPDAFFDEKDEPVGDRRWWLKEAFLRENEVWHGPEPDQFSPHTRTEEKQIEAALREGIIAPRNDYEHRYIEFMGTIVRYPEKTVTCSKCGKQWVARAFPAGRLPQMNLVPGLEGGWIFPKRCLECDDRAMAKRRPKPPADKPQGKIINLPYKDPNA